MHRCKDQFGEILLKSLHNISSCEHGTAFLQSPEFHRRSWLRLRLCPVVAVSGTCLRVITRVCGCLKGEKAQNNFYEHPHFY